MRCALALLVTCSTAYADAPPKCLTVDAKPLTVGTAPTAGEYTLAAEVESASATSWGEAGNEALVLDVAGAHRPQHDHLAGIDHFTFDAYGIYLLAIGDAFVPKPEGDNSATLDYVRRGVKEIGVYVDDDASTCKDGTITGGPHNAKMKCAGGQVDISK